MRPEPRPPKPNDQKNTEKAFRLILELYEKHPEIEPSLWAGALWSALANGYLNCHFTFDEFKRQIDDMLKHTKKYYDIHT